MLNLVFGQTIYSVSMVMLAFIAGFWLGSYLWGTTIDKTRKPLLVFGKIELLIGLWAAFISLLFSSAHLLGNLYANMKQNKAEIINALKIIDIF
jgi:uncharacterized membrane protein